MLARLISAAGLVLVTVGLLAAPASANCGEVGIPGKPPVIIIHC